jgi:hypothetical protein
MLVILQILLYNIYKPMCYQSHKKEKKIEIKFINSFIMFEIHQSHLLPCQFVNVI